MTATFFQHVLITGGSGLLALNWACALREQCQVTLGTHCHDVILSGVASCPLSLDDPQLFAHQLRQIAPDLIIHCAGITSVDQCEQNPTDALFVNAQIARTVAECAARQSRRLVHISTDHLFSGQEQMYSEDALPQPLNEYARSKLLAEQWVVQVCPTALILRTNFFGWGHAGRQSFSDWVIYGLREGRTLSMFADVYFTPILADALALSAHRLASIGAHGVFNLVGGERLSKYAFGLRLARIFGLSQDLIRPSQLAQSQLTAKRPLDMSLDNRLLINVLGESPGKLDDWFVSLLDQERLGRREELLHAIGGSNAE